MRISLNPRSASLHAFLTRPASLTEHPTYRMFQERIAKARAAHMPVKAHQEALQAWLHQALRGGE